MLKYKEHGSHDRQEEWTWTSGAEEGAEQGTGIVLEHSPGERREVLTKAACQEAVEHGIELVGVAPAMTGMYSSSKWKQEVA